MTTVYWEDRPPVTEDSAGLLGDHHVACGLLVMTTVYVTP
jgi:hypothetical protein